MDDKGQHYEISESFTALSNLVYKGSINSEFARIKERDTNTMKMLQRKNLPQLLGCVEEVNVRSELV